MLQCPACRQLGEDEKCVACDRWRVIRDPEPPDIPTCELGHGMHVLWQASVSVGHGYQAPRAIVQPVGIVARDLQEMLRDAESTPLEAELVSQCMAALQRIHAFATSRNVADLNQGWMLLVFAARKLKQLEEQGFTDADEHPGLGSQPEAAPMELENPLLAANFYNPSDSVVFDLDD